LVVAFVKGHTNGTSDHCLPVVIGTKDRLSKAFLRCRLLFISLFAKQTTNGTSLEVGSLYS